MSIKKGQEEGRERESIRYVLREGERVTSGGGGTFGGFLVRFDPANRK
jgi:hypothetical protein